MSSQKKFFSSFYRIFVKVVTIFFIVILFSYIWKVSAQVIHYQEYIHGKENLGDKKKIEEGAQNLDEIEKIERAILSEAEIRLKKKGQTYSEKEELRKAKEKLRKVEKEAIESKQKYEEENEKYKKAKENFSSTKEQRGNTGELWQISQDNEETRKRELEDVRQKVIENIQEELKKADLSVTELDIEFVTEGKKWEKRS